MSTKNKRFAFLIPALSLSSCTIVRSPVLPEGTPTTSVYVLTASGWMTWLGIVDHVALVLPEYTPRSSELDQSEPTDCPPPRLVQFGFGDSVYMNHTGLVRYLWLPFLVTYGSLFPTPGCLERRFLNGHPAGEQREREAWVRERTGMCALELVVATERAQTVAVALNHLFESAHAPGDQLELTTRAPQSYRFVFGNCHDFTAHWLRELGVDIHPARILPRGSFWLRL